MPARKNRVFAIILLLSFVPSIVLAGESQLLPRLRVVTQDGRTIRGESGFLDEESLRARTASGEILLLREEIRILEIEDGSEAGRFAMIGGGLGLLLALGAIASVESDPNAEVNEDRVLPVTAAVVGVGVVIGAALGAAHPKWSKVTVAGGIDPHRPGGVLLSMGIRF